MYLKIIASSPKCHKKVLPISKQAKTNEKMNTDSAT